MIMALNSAHIIDTLSFSLSPRKLSEKALCLIKRRKGLYKNYLIDRSYENKRNVKKVEKALKRELRRCE